MELIFRLIDKVMLSNIELQSSIPYQDFLFRDFPLSGFYPFGIHKFRDFVFLDFTLSGFSPFGILHFRDFTLSGFTNFGILIFGISPFRDFAPRDSGFSGF